MKKIEFKSPFYIYQQAVELITNDLNICQSDKNHLFDISSLAFPPPTFEAVKAAANILYRVKMIKEINSNQQGTSRTSNAKKYSIQEYPIFGALEKLDRMQWPSLEIKCLSVNLYISFFELKKLMENDLDSSLFYDDAYFCRDVFLNYLNDFIFSTDNCTTRIKFKESMIKQCRVILKNETEGTNKFKKIKRFLDISTGNHIPGERHRKKTSPTNTLKDNIDCIPPDPAYDYNGAGVDVSYPDEDSTNPKAYTRSTPSGGSKLTYTDDKRSIYGWANAQAARNIYSITDMQRLPFPCVSSFFTHLVSTKLQVLAYFWILITTGLQPERLQDATVKSGNRPRNQHGLYIDIDTGILSYEVINRPEEYKHDLMQLNISKEVISYVGDCDNCQPFQNMLPEIEMIVRKFSLHNPGQSPTRDRIAASCIIIFLAGQMSEIESAYLSGNIPPKLRAQSHYYPIDIETVNHKYKAAHDVFITRLLNSPSSNRLAASYFELFSHFRSAIPTGMIGSVDSIPITALQAVLDQLKSRLILTKKSYQTCPQVEKLQKFYMFIKIQHIQLFIIEQLTFCARKFGDKTSYSVSLFERKVWGSEKASAGASIERKLIPLSNLLERQLQVCEADMALFISLAAQFKYSLDGGFNIRSNPLPVDITIDDEKRKIILTKMHSKTFNSLLEKMNINDMPQPSSPKVNIFKHIMAGGLLNNIPQILLDEIMTHDRDGLDFCSNYGTGSANSMRLASDGIERLLARLDFQLIALRNE